MTRREFDAVLLGGAASAESTVRAASPDAPVRVEAGPANDFFSIENGLIRKQVRVNAQDGLRLDFFGFAGGANLAAGNTRWGSELYVKVGADFYFGIAGRRFEFLGHQPAADELVLRFRDTVTKLEYTTHTRAFPGLVVLEQWIEIRNGGAETVTVERFDPLLLPMSLAAQPSGVRRSSTCLRETEVSGMAIALSADRPITTSSPSRLNSCPAQGPALQISFWAGAGGALTRGACPVALLARGGPPAEAGVATPVGLRRAGGGGGMSTNPYDAVRHHSDRPTD